MQETKESASCAGNNLCDAVRFLCEASYAVLPEDVAHQLGEMKKNFLGGVRWVIEKDIQWIDECVKGGDRLREEWRRKSAGASRSATGEGAAGSGI
ncbi:MAG TPA: hypothetical protein VM911_12415 [Pyrinomonadaceae bacterium]|nr:hypothetical protein [Pyrinomonadaceae bacterium]